MPSCIDNQQFIPPPYFYFYNDIDVNDSIFVEYKHPETNDISLNIIKYQEECSVYTDSYYGTILDKLPPDDFVFDNLNNFTIYRFKDNTFNICQKNIMTNQMISK